MRRLASIKQQWPTKLIWLIIGGLILHFVSGLYWLLVGAAGVLLLAHYIQAFKRADTMIDATKQLLARAFPLVHPNQAPSTYPRSTRVTQNRSREVPTAVDARHYTEPTRSADPDELFIPSEFEQSPPDPDYRCFEHGLDHDCPLEHD